MEAALFDFELPEDRIALRPAVPRDSARMMVVHPDGCIEHRHVRDLPDFLSTGDALVVNDTRVLPARLHGTRLRGANSAKVELLLHRRLAQDRYAVLARPAKKLSPGDHLQFGALAAHVAQRGQGGEAEVVFALSGGALDAAIAAQGEMPLPPYIARQRKADARDVTDYQTIFAREAGSVAAPTAGLHFTPELQQRLLAKGIFRESLTLHVGLGTFLPVVGEDISTHRMHPEFALLDAKCAGRLNDVRTQGNKIMAVGTTSLRTLESAVDQEGRLQPFAGETSIFIKPGHVFHSADILLTNFHLPRSTLFMLVSAFMGLEVMRAAYNEAIGSGYRFYSYGDACLLFRPK